MANKKQTYILVPNYYDLGGDIVAGKGLGKFGQSLGKLGEGVGAIGSAVGGIAGNLISDGMTSGAGDVIGKLGDVAGAIPGPWGAVAGAGLKVIGGLTNRAFGSKMNTENINKIEANTNKMKSFTSDVGSFDVLGASMSSAPVGMGFSRSTVGKDGLFSKKAKRKYNQLKAEAQAANEWVDNSFMNNLSNLKNSQNANLMANYSALGGPIDKLGLYADGGQLFAGGGALDPYSAGSLVNAIYDSSIGEEFLGRPSHNYDFTQSDEWANSHGYYPDSRGHRDDRVKKPAHPTHPSRGNWTGNVFNLTDKGMRDPNYILFGMNDGGQDPQAIMSYKGGMVLPEITVTPRNSYINNSYDNTHIIMGRKKALGGPINFGYMPIGGAIDYEMAQRRLAQGDLEAQTKGVTKQAFIPPVYALGGNLRTNGMDWTNGIILVDNGGTHEENPLQGVPMGIDDKGNPNLVEEGEVIWNNYVFSNRIPIPDELAKALKIHGKNMTFADAAKKAQKESEERPNDPISKRGLQASMARLQAAQESLKQQLVGQQGDDNGQEGQSSMYSGGGDLSNKLKAIDLSAFPLYANYVHPKGSTAYGFRNKLANVPAKDGGGFAYYKDGKYDQSYLDFVNNVNDEDAKVIAEYIKDYTGKVLTPAQLRANAIDIGKKGGGYGVAHQILGQLYNSKANTPTTNDNTGTGTRGTYEWGFGQGLDNFWTALGKADNSNNKEVAGAIANGASPWEAMTHYDTAYVNNPGNSNIKVPYAIEEQDKENAIKKPSDPNKDSLLAYLRYAPAVGAGLGVFSDLMGWTNKPDYTNADLALNSANGLRDVHYSPIGDYTKYTPLDREFYINQLNAQAGSTRRAITNNSGGNRGQAIAGILAADYGAQGQLGQLARQAEEYNLGQRERVATFNRGTNMFNSENDLKTQMANNGNREVQMRAALTAAQMRDAADARASAGRSANLTNFFDSLGNIGIDTVNRQDRDRLIRAGVFGTLSQRPYGWSDKRWKAYQDAVQGIGFDNEKACGGKLKTKKKKGLTI